MHFLIVGTGGIGGYYGARLQDADHSVVLVARGEHLTALQQTGLSVVHEQFTFDQPVTAVSEQALTDRYRADDFDIILLTLKSQDTGPWLNRMSSWLNQGETPVLSLQNGVDNEPEIAQALGSDRTMGGLAVRIGGHITTPGHIEASGPAQIILGPWPTSDSTAALAPLAQTLAGQFESAHIPSQVSPDIRTELWRKLLINNGVNPLSALTGLDTRQLTHNPSYAQAVRAMMQEAASAARADDVNLSSDDVADMFALISQFNAIKTSMLVDREKGRPLELDAITGAVLRRGRDLDLDTPVTALVDGLLRTQTDTKI